MNISTYAVRVKLAEGHTWKKETFIAEIVLLRLTPILLVSGKSLVCEDGQPC